MISYLDNIYFFFFSSRRRHSSWPRDWSSDVCSSDLIILTSWLLTNVLSHSVWVTLHIVAFFIGGYAQAKEGIIDTIEEKELNEIGRASCRERVYCSVIGTLMEEKEC